MRLDELRRKRDELLAWAPAAEAFGPYWREWQQHHRRWARATEAAVVRLERQEGLSLPDEYRQFVTEVADGGLGPGCGMFSVSDAIEQAPEFTGVLTAAFPYRHEEARSALAKRAHGDRWLSLDQPHESGLPGGALLLAHTGCGCFDILVVTGEQRGTVWYHDLRTLFPLASETKQLGFFDWYERWLDGCLRSLVRS